ncbi:LPS export ABC transporter permease LptF [Desulfosediminicola ganghwensis]|uniref:LPS export ABC transporter permease LptF n=1 Tax=Desulfosediminicola ganghwensis TaxID=2569540 RepID=UPI0010AC2F0B|nr:LPS export ABC transporter permease LptF [Desulfosediminicola ganghwensis]
MKALTRNPFLLYSYLSTEMLAPFFASFLIMNGVFFLVKLIPFLNFALDLDISFTDFVRMFSYMMPNMLLYTLPMAAMMGVIIAFSRLSSDMEILALKASGISVYRILPPLFIVALSITLATTYISTKLIPASEISMKQLTYQLLKEKIDKGIKEYQFTEALGDLVVHVGEIDNDTGQWTNVWVSDMRGQKNPSITMASKGRMFSNLDEMNITILLENGSLHRPDEKDAQIVNFERYIINIPLQPGSQPKPSERKSLGMMQLYERAHEKGLNTEDGRELLTEFHKRLVLPFGCLILTILGLPLGLQSGPGKRATGIPYGLAVFVLYYVLFTLGRTLADDGKAPVAFIMWLPNAIFLLIAFYAINRVTHEKPILPERLQFMLNNLYAIALKPFVYLWKKIYNLLFGSRTEVSQSPSGDKPGEEIADDELKVLRGDEHAKIYHYSQCRLYNQDSCSTTFLSAAWAEEAGFKPCKLCAPKTNISPAAPPSGSKGVK